MSEESKEDERRDKVQRHSSLKELPEKREVVIPANVRDENLR